MAGKITMNNKNGYEFSVLEIRVQLIILKFPLPTQECPDHARERSMYWALTGQLILDRSGTSTEFPGFLALLVGGRKRGGDGVP